MCALRFNVKTGKIRYRFDFEENDCHLDPEEAPVVHGGGSTYVASMAQSNWLLTERFGVRESEWWTQTLWERITFRRTEHRRRSCRGIPRSTDHAPVLFNKCACLEALSLFRDEILATESRREGLAKPPLFINTDTLYSNYHVDMGYGERVEGNTLPHIFVGGVQSNGVPYVPLDELEGIISGGQAMTMNFQGPGMDLAYPNRCVVSSFPPYRSSDLSDCVTEGPTVTPICSRSPS